ncbi:hypothetical protein ACHWQZ_G005406 [Mnemiopsis leidyi]
MKSQTDWVTVDVAIELIKVNMEELKRQQLIPLFRFKLDLMKGVLIHIYARSRSPCFGAIKSSLNKLDYFLDDTFSRCPTSSSNEPDKSPFCCRDNTYNKQTFRGDGRPTLLFIGHQLQTE